MFAGPNGSGKSVLKSSMPDVLLGVYLNADDIEAGGKKCGFVDLRNFNVETTEEEVMASFRSSQRLTEKGLAGACESLRFAEGLLYFPPALMNSHIASEIVDFLRQKLMAMRRSLTMETVMSHPSKVALLKTAQEAGYRTYLYYVATDDPTINVSRVENRVKLNGHNVPNHLVTRRYYLSLEALMSAIRFTHRAYIFDNSTDNADRTHTWLAEITDGRTLELKTDMVPAWFKRSVLDKFTLN